MALEHLERPPVRDRAGPSPDLPSRLGGSLAGRFRRAFLGISLRETHFETRGFDRGDEADRRRLEGVGAAFAWGYHAALAAGPGPVLHASLSGLPPFSRGFAYEGAAMALGLFDALAPWRRDRWRTLLAGPGEHFDYLVHVGLGWVFARLRRRPDASLPGMDPLLRCLCIDGYGFHEAYFDWPRFIHGGVPRRPVAVDLQPLFDQGVGRALWFGRAAVPGAIEETVRSYAEARRGDLWSGVGLALAYAGRERAGAAVEALEAAGSYRAHLAQGVAFAAEAHVRQETVGEALVDACTIVWERLPEDVAARVRKIRAGLGSVTGLAGYGAWRAGIRAESSAVERA